MHGLNSERWEKSTSSKEDRLAIRRARQLCLEIERRNAEKSSSSYKQEWKAGKSSFQSVIPEGINNNTKRELTLDNPFENSYASKIWNKSANNASSMSYLDACLFGGTHGQEVASTNVEGFNSVKDIACLNAGNPAISRLTHDFSTELSKV